MEQPKDYFGQPYSADLEALPSVVNPVTGRVLGEQTPKFYLLLSFSYPNAFSVGKMFITYLIYVLSVGFFHYAY